MAAEVPDELLDQSIVTAPKRALADAILTRYEGRATRVVSYFGGLDWSKDPTALQGWADVARGVTVP